MIGAGAEVFSATPRKCFHTGNFCMRHQQLSSTVELHAHTNTMADEDVNLYDEIEIEDCFYDETLQIYHHPCPCGDRFEISIADMRDGEDIARCPSCSLMIRIIFDQVSCLGGLPNRTLEALMLRSRTCHLRTIMRHRYLPSLRRWTHAFRMRFGLPRTHAMIHPGVHLLLKTHCKDAARPSSS